jgi:hypothetical protein
MVPLIVDLAANSWWSRIYNFEISTCESRIIKDVHAQLDFSGLASYLAVNSWRVTLHRLLIVTSVSFALLVVFFVGRMAVDTWENDLRYRQALPVATMDCNTRGGDVLRPYGMIGWINVASMENPTVLACIRYGKVWNYKLAIYKYDGQRFNTEETASGFNILWHGS